MRVNIRSQISFNVSAYSAFLHHNTFMNFNGHWITTAKSHVFRKTIYKIFKYKYPIEATRKIFFYKSVSTLY